MTGKRVWRGWNEKTVRSRGWIHSGNKESSILKGKIVHKFVEISKSCTTRQSQAGIFRAIWYTRCWETWLCVLQCFCKPGAAADMSWCGQAGQAARRGWNPLGFPMGHCFAASWLRLYFSELLWLHRNQKQLCFKLLHDLSPRPIFTYLGSNTGWMAASKCLWIAWETGVLCDTILGLTDCFPKNKLNGAKAHSQAPDLSCDPALTGWSFWLVCHRGAEALFGWFGSHKSVHIEIFHMKHFVLTHWPWYSTIIFCWVNFWS